MKAIKNPTTLLLMGSSLALLLVLQAFWLYDSYEKTFYDFRKDVNGLFRQTVISMRDSALMEHIETLPSDTTIRSRSTFVFIQKMDSPFSHQKTRTHLRTSRQFNMLISSDAKEDSVKNMIKLVVGKIHEGKMKGGNFMIRVGSDSLSSDSIHKYVSKALLQAKVQLPFMVKKVEYFPNDNFSFPPKFNIKMRKHRGESESGEALLFSDTLKTDWVQTDPVNQYAAEFSGVNFLILKRIIPQILFSILLTLLTALAFIVMYRSIRSQQRLMEIKNDFISNVTHELKTPVTTVGVALEALRNFKGLENPQRTEEYLDIAQGELNRLSILTDKILKTATFESKGVHFEPEPVDLFKTIEQVLHSMKLVFEKQKAQVSFEKTGDSFTIVGGNVHLTNMIYNLLDNALKYSEGQPHISISLADQENKVVLKVTDKGIGIPKEYIKKIFEKFFRVPAGDVHNVKGYGLGLSYVESVIKSHRGNISVASESGKGSTFTISLPKTFSI